MRGCVCEYILACRILIRTPEIECSCRCTAKELYVVQYALVLSYEHVCTVPAVTERAIARWMLASRFVERRTSQSRRFVLSPREKRQLLQSSSLSKALTSGLARLWEPRQHLGPSSTLDNLGTLAMRPPPFAFAFAFAVKARLRGESTLRRSMIQNALSA